jgi:hypothetical protein
MGRVKQASKRKRTTKFAAAKALGAAGLGFSLMGSATASAVPTSDTPRPENTSTDLRFVLGEEEMADVSLATFHLFDRENVGGGNVQVAWRGCGGCGGCRGCGGFRGCGVGFVGGCGGCGCRGCGGCGWGWGAPVGVGLGLGLGALIVGSCAACAGCTGCAGCCASWGSCRFCDPAT